MTREPILALRENTATIMASAALSNTSASYVTIRFTFNLDILLTLSMTGVDALSARQSRSNLEDRRSMYLKADTTIVIV